MPGFNADARARIKRAVRKSEGLDTTGKPLHIPSAEDFGWLKLINDFGTETTDMAEANPGIWHADFESGDGTYEADVTLIYDVRDPHGDCGAVAGDWVFCRCIGSDNGAVWEVLFAPAAFAIRWGTLDAAMPYNSAGVTVSLDAGGDIDDVLPPKDMDSGEIPSGAHVAIGLIDGDWYVVHALVSKTFITDLQIGASYIQKKTLAVLVFAAGTESDWTNTTMQVTACP